MTLYGTKVEDIETGDTITRGDGVSTSTIRAASVERTDDTVIIRWVDAIFGHDIYPRATYAAGQTLVIERAS